jgi:hypothetical protein
MPSGLIEPVIATARQMSKPTPKGAAMRTLRHATLMLVALLLTGALPAAAQAGKSFFETSFRTNFTNDCVQSAKESAAGHVREESLVSFCECSVNRTIKELTIIDLLKISLAGKMPAAVDAKLDKVMEACWRENLPDTPASR